MAAKEFLYCYKMTHDTGYAPNPYHGVLGSLIPRKNIQKNKPDNQSNQRILLPDLLATQLIAVQP